MCDICAETTGMFGLVKLILHKCVAVHLDSSLAKPHSLKLATFCLEVKNSCTHGALATTKST